MNDTYTVLLLSSNDRTATYEFIKTSKRSRKSLTRLAQRHLVLHFASLRSDGLYTEGNIQLSEILFHTNSDAGDCDQLHFGNSA